MASLHVNAAQGSQAQSAQLMSAKDIVSMEAFVLEIRHLFPAIAQKVSTKINAVPR